MKEFFEKNSVMAMVLIWIILTIPIYMGVKGIAAMFRLTDEPLVSAIQLMSTYIAPTIWLLLKLSKHKIKIKEYICIPKSKIRKSEIAFVVGMGMLFSAGTVIIFEYVLSYIAPKFLETIINQDPIGKYPIMQTIISAITTVIIAPIIEELIFRGFIFNRLSYKYKISNALIITSIVFGILHDVDTLGAGVFSIMAIILYRKYNSLRPGIYCHMIHNLISQLFTITSIGSAETTVNDIRSNGVGFGIFLFLISAPFCFIYIRNNWPQNNIKNMEETELISV